MEGHHSKCAAKSQALHQQYQQLDALTSNDQGFSASRQAQPDFTSQRSTQHSALYLPRLCFKIVSVLFLTEFNLFFYNTAAEFDFESRVWRQEASASVVAYANTYCKYTLTTTNLHSLRILSAGSTQNIQTTKSDIAISRFLHRMPCPGRKLLSAAITDCMYPEMVLKQ